MRDCSWLFFVFIEILTLRLNAQIIESFDDGDFTLSPIWEGSDTNFIINNEKQLQLNASGAATSFLATSNFQIDSTEWEFYTKLSFAPSDNNFLKVYLVSDTSDLTIDLNGYFLKIGENGSDDGIDLYKQEGSTLTKLIDGIAGHASKSTNTLRIKVIRGTQGNWSVYCDTIGGTNYLLEGIVVDSSIQQTTYFGVVCTNTSSNNTKFYFDDFYIGDVKVDTIAPTVEQLYVLSEDSIAIKFSEVVDKSEAENVVNFLVDGGIGIPFSANLDMDDPRILYLTMTNLFVNGSFYSLSISNVTDKSGNPIIDTVVNFSFYNPQAYDIVVNEIMADPDPVVSLPEYEYLELYNTTGFDINLDGWNLEIGTKLIGLEEIILTAGDYLIVTSDDGYVMLSAYGNIYESESFTSLTNTGQTITLLDDKNNIIHTVSYDDSWYNSSVKEDGGWSLEQIDYDNPCGGSGNWSASESLKGGTPGSANSIYEINSDLTAPEPQRISITDSLNIILYYTESMQYNSINNINSYFISSGIGNPLNITLYPPDYTQIGIVLQNPLQPETIYTISIHDTLYDCAGNILDTTINVRFGIPDTISPGDIIINEVLFNPLNNGEDYVEIYNYSDKIIDLKDLRISQYDEYMELESLDVISEDGYLVFPQEYILLTVDPDAVKSQYYTSNTSGFIKMEDMPALNNTEGSVVLLKNNLKIIDYFFYDEDMHYALLDDVDGISLERISFEDSTNSGNNWHSASENSGFGTPGYLNSQAYTLSESDEIIVIEPDIFSPDNDGYNDVLFVSYNMESSGFTGTVRIYDINGRLVTTLANNELLGVSGSLIWDGIMDNNLKARIGVYIVVFEAFNLQGEIIKKKTTCTLGGKLGG